MATLLLARSGTLGQQEEGEDVNGRKHADAEERNEGQRQARNGVHDARVGPRESNCRRKRGHEIKHAKNMHGPVTCGAAPEQHHREGEETRSQIAISRFVDESYWQQTLCPIPREEWDRGSM